MMDPTNNQPGAPGQPNPQPGQQPAVPTPDWQQGLTTNPANPQTIVPPSGVPGSVVGNSDVPPATNGSGSLEPAPVGPGNGGRSKRFRLIMILIAAVVVLTTAGAAYMLLKKDKNTDANSAAESSSSTSEDEAIDLSSLDSLTFGLPTDLSDFQDDSSPTDTYHVYLTKGSTDKKACSLEFGILTAAQLPGNDLNGIVNPQIESLKELGAEVEGPTAGEALTMKDSKDDSVTYSLPTVNYVFTKDNGYVSVHYSLAILKNDSRAVVSRQCVNADGAIDDETFSNVETAAKQITITAQ